MKDIKSIVIGFLMATCMFLFMGYSTKKETGRYQATAVYQGDNPTKLYDVLVTVIDTQDGSIVSTKGLFSHKYKK